MPWIKVEHDLHEKEQVFSIAHSLGLDVDAVVGKLTRIWSWADHHTDYGVFKAPIAFLDHLARCEGFGLAMLNVGWINELDGSIQIVDFAKLFGDPSKRELRRKQNREAQRRRRGVDSPEDDACDAAESVSSMSATRQQHVSNTSAACIPAKTETETKTYSESGSGVPETASDSEERYFSKVPELAEASQRIIAKRPPGRLNHGVFRPLKEEHLADVKRLIEWHAKQLGALNPVCGETEAHLLCVLAAGLYVSDLPPNKVETRVGKFASIIRHRQWRTVTGFIPDACRYLQEYQQRKGTACDTQETTAAD